MMKKGLVCAIVVLFIGMSIVPIAGSLSMERVSTDNRIQNPNLGDDTTPPVTTCTLDPDTPDGDNGWYVSDVEVTLNATDDMSGVDFIKYLLDDNDWLIYTDPFKVKSDDYHRITYYAVDKAGNVEQPSDVLRFKTDQTPPDIEEVEWETFQDPPIYGLWYVTFTCDATDATSGMDRVELYIYDGWHETIKGPGPIYKFIMAISFPSFIIFNFFHYDFAGNSAFDSVNASDIKSYSRSQSSSQQPSSTPSSQNTVSVIPSNGNIGKASSICKSNNPPYVPSNPYPIGEITDPNVTLSWDGGDPDPDDNVTYSVYFGVNPPSFIATVGPYPANKTRIHYYLGTVGIYKTYYWMIVAWDNHGASSSSPIWSFTTGINHPPSTPIIDGPTHGKVGVEYEYTFNSTDGDGHDFCYCVDWGDDSPIEIVCPSNPDGSGVAKANHSWDTERTYIIRARAKDIYDAVGPWGYLEVTMPKNKPDIQNSQQQSQSSNSQQSTNPLFFQIVQRLMNIQ